MLVSQLSPTLWDPHGLQPMRLLCPWDSPGKNTGVGCHFLLQGIFQIQGSNLGLLHCRQILYHMSHQGSPFEAAFYQEQERNFSVMNTLWDVVLGYNHHLKGGDPEVTVTLCKPLMLLPWLNVWNSGFVTKADFSGNLDLGHRDRSETS